MPVPTGVQGLPSLVASCGPELSTMASPLLEPESAPLDPELLPLPDPELLPLLDPELLPLLDPELLPLLDPELLPLLDPEPLPLLEPDPSAAPSPVVWSVVASPSLPGASPLSKVPRIEVQPPAIATTANARAPRAQSRMALFYITIAV